MVVALFAADVVFVRSVTGGAILTPSAAIRTTFKGVERVFLSVMVAAAIVAVGLIVIILRFARFGRAWRSAEIDIDCASCAVTVVVYAAASAEFRGVNFLPTPIILG